jgi:hypothetical protein
MESSLSKVTLVGYSEKVDIFGLVQVSPVSSGYCLGSSNWLIASASTGVRIGYVSGSSTLATHPKPIDKSSLRGVDCLLLTSLTVTPTKNPDTMIGDFCRTVCETVKQGGNVLVPCYPSGKTLINLPNGFSVNGSTLAIFFFLRFWVKWRTWPSHTLRCRHLRLDRFNRHLLHHTFSFPTH